jgi:putative phosphoesterase
VRVALISDIHGNLTALDAVLDELAAEEIDRVACLGDVASDSPQPCEVLGRLRALQCPVVMGNADAEVLGLIPVSGAPEMRMVSEAALWCADRLNADERAFMASFERRVEIAVANWSLLLFHGSPSDFNAKILPSTPDDSLRETFASFSAQVMAGGHTYLQMARQIDEAMLINPGSVGMAYDRAAEDEVELAAWAEYAVLMLAEDAFRVELRKVAFDVEAHLTAIRRSGMPYADFWTSAWARAGRL